MVATVIAILALLILPIYRERVEKARETAALDELASLAKAILLVNADVNIYPRLNDLDNGPQISPAGAIDVANEPPVASWNATLETAQLRRTRASVVENWNGPYAAYRKTLTLGEIDGLTTPNGLWFSDNGGPIYSVSTVAGTQYTDPVGNVFEDDGDDRYPVDPWGTPYIYFGPETVFNSGVGRALNYSVLYSLGQDGLPGSAPDLFSDPDFLSRTGGFLGDPNSDDLEYRF